MDSENQQASDDIGEAPQGGHPSPLLPQAHEPNDKETWNCPYCEHSLRYSLRDREVAELAANSHVNRQHRDVMTIIVLPDNSEVGGP
jgi:hypothetical protein